MLSKDRGKRPTPFLQTSSNLSLIFNFVRVAYLESTKNFISSAENFVPDKDTAKLLLDDHGKAEMQHMKMLATDLMTTKEVNRPMFCLFTGNYDGKNWVSIIQKAIKEDMLKKKKKKDKPLFRPAKEIDQLIEKQARDRFEREHNNRVLAQRAKREEQQKGSRRRGIIEEELR